MTVPLAMKHRTLRRFPLRRRCVPVAAGAISLVTPTSMDDLLAGEWLARYERLGYLPYWADIWPAALGLVQWLFAGPSFAAARVLDLGCGVGLAGIAAGMRGARVTFADLDPDALEFARFNAEANGLQDITTVRLDWGHQTVAGRFDCVLLADVAYEAVHFEPLLRHVRRCVAPGGRALLGDPFRAVASGFLGLVMKEFATVVHETEVVHDDHRVRVRIVEITEITECAR